MENNTDQAFKRKYALFFLSNQNFIFLNEFYLNSTSLNLIYENVSIIFDLICRIR